MYVEYYRAMDKVQELSDSGSHTLRFLFDFVCYL
jgi:hypothetical protein